MAQVHAVGLVLLHPGRTLPLGIFVPVDVAPLPISRVKDNL